ncbi:MAG: flagellar hook-length control protein FliK, partial [Bdellovibrionota bacterium]
EKVLNEKKGSSQSDRSLNDDKNLSRDLKKDQTNKNEPVGKSPTTKNEKLETVEARQPKQITEKSEKTNASPEPVAAQKVQSADESSEAATREKVMATFLDRMQSQLGIEPEQFVEAFSQLEISDLALPPEETVGKVIESLDLDEAQKLVAENLYSEMLVMSAAANMSQYLKDNSQTANLEVLSPEQASKKQLQKNIDQMNTQFFVNNKQPKEATEVSGRAQKAMGIQAYAAKDFGAQAPGLAQDSNLALNSANPALNAMGSQNAPLTNAFSKANQIDLSALGLEDVPLDAETESAIADLQLQLSEMGIQAPSDQAALPDLALDNSGYVAKEMNVDMKASAAAAGLAAASPEIQSLEKSNSTEFGFGSSSSNSEDSSGKEGSVDQNDPSAFSLDGAQKLAKNQPQFNVQAPKASAVEAQGNIQEIISQAQFLAKKGGGEMNVQMSPEGMGDLKLKVAIVDGQVSVEMITSNNEAKKLIEKGMGELKASLAGHKLNIDQIRIDAAPEASNQMNQNNGQDANRQYQQRFLQDFRDNNNGHRREFFDIGTAAVPGSQLRDRASNASYDPSARKKASSRRLDVVA